MGKDYYVVLKIGRTATASEIRSAYCHRALEVHPDRSESESKAFIELQEAYSVMSDLARRAAYERQAESVPLRRRASRPSPLSSAGPFREVEPAAGFREVSLARSFGAFSPSADEIFDRVRGNFDLSPRPKAEHLESLTVDVPLSWREADSGGSVQVLVPARMACAGCGGRGSVGFYECWRCRGQGALAVEYPLEVPYPAGLLRDCVVRVALHDLGIRNLYLTVRFRPSATV